MKPSSVLSITTNDRECKWNIHFAIKGDQVQCVFMNLWDARCATFEEFVHSNERTGLLEISDDMIKREAQHVCTLSISDIPKLVKCIRPNSNGECHGLIVENSYADSLIYKCLLQECHTNIRFLELTIPFCPEIGMTFLEDQIRSGALVMLQPVGTWPEELIDLVKEFVQQPQFQWFCINKLTGLVIPLNLNFLKTMLLDWEEFASAYGPKELRFNPTFTHAEVAAFRGAMVQTDGYTILFRGDSNSIAVMDFGGEVSDELVARYPQSFGYRLDGSRVQHASLRLLKCCCANPATPAIDGGDQCFYCALVLDGEMDVS
uniref:FBA_2 domain-containing protein n=1 Tax=Steinernema glaseri TaxID=37863 RepID=A0A1I8A5L0_9BILA